MGPDDVAGEVIEFGQLGFPVQDFGHDGSGAEDAQVCYAAEKNGRFQV